MGAPNAFGDHHHLVSFRKCNRALVAYDFGDNLEEVSAPTFLHGHDFAAEASSCIDAGLTEEADVGRKELTDGELGVECVANVLQLTKEEKTPPPGGCYRIVHTALIVTTGSRVTRMISELRRGVKDRFWPRNYVRHVARGIGNRAEWGYGDEEKGYAYLQLLNATMTIETRGHISLLHTLRLAAAAL